MAVSDYRGGFVCTNEKCRSGCTKMAPQVISPMNVVCTCSCGPDNPPPEVRKEIWGLFICGPDITDWLATELTMLAKASYATGRGIIFRGARNLNAFGGSLRYGRREGESTIFSVSGSGCPTGTACIHTVTVCGKCIDKSEVGNMALGAMGPGFGFGSAIGLIGRLKWGVSKRNWAVRLGMIDGVKVHDPDKPEDETSILAGYFFGKGLRSVAGHGPAGLCAAIAASAGSAKPGRSIQAPHARVCIPCKSSVTDRPPRRNPGVPGGPPPGANSGNHSTLKWKGKRLVGIKIPPIVSGERKR